MTENHFEPQILAFCCQHCAYAAADLAGGLRLDYPASIKIIGLPCTGKFDVLFALRAFEDGADGIMVAGWLEGDCHYLEGNLNARSRVKATQKILSDVGLEPERIDMFNLSSAMGAQFAQTAGEVVQRIKDIGPNPLRTDKVGTTNT